MQRASQLRIEMHAGAAGEAPAEAPSAEESVDSPPARVALDKIDGEILSRSPDHGSLLMSPPRSLGSPLRSMSPSKLSPSNKLQPRPPEEREAAPEEVQEEEEEEEEEEEVPDLDDGRVEVLVGVGGDEPQPLGAAEPRAPDAGHAPGTESGCRADRVEGDAAAQAQEGAEDVRTASEAAGAEAWGAAQAEPCYWEYRDWEASGAAEVSEFFLGGESGPVFAGGEAAAERLRRRGPHGESEEGWAELLESADPALRRDAAAAILQSCLRPACGDGPWLAAARVAARRSVRAGAVPALARCVAGTLESAVLRGGPASSGGCEAAFGAVCAFTNALYALLVLAPGPPPAPPPSPGPAPPPPPAAVPPPEPTADDEAAREMVGAQLREPLWPGDGAPVLATVLMSALEGLDRPSPPPIPARKLLLLLHRAVLLSLGSTAALRAAKLAALAALRGPGGPPALAPLKSRPGDAERLEAGSLWAAALPAPSAPLAAATALLRSSLHLPFAAIRRALPDSAPDTDAPRRAATEVVYASAMGGGGRHVLLLLKLLLAASSAVRNYSGSIDLQAELSLARRLAPSEPPPRPQEGAPGEPTAAPEAPRSSSSGGAPSGTCDAPPEELGAHKELVVKSVSALLLLYLKHFRATDEAMGERMRELLLQANAVILLLKVAHLDVLQRTKRPAPPPALDCCFVDEEGHVPAERHVAHAATPGGSWRAHFATANVLRVLQRVTKRSEDGTRALAQCKAAGVLKRAAEWGEGDVQLYALKLLKGQIREQGRKWRITNMHLITAIYERVRLDLADPWLSYPPASPVPAPQGQAPPQLAATQPPPPPEAPSLQQPPVRVWCSECAVELRATLVQVGQAGLGPHGPTLTCLRCMARLLELEARGIVQLPQIQS
eukprot:tig00020614_g12225.t1